MSLLDLAREQLGQQDIDEIGRELGTDPVATQQAIDAALPMMLGGMASTAQQPGGETAMRSAMGLVGGTPAPDGASALGGLGALGGLAGALGGGGGLGGILGNILGQHQPTVEDGVQKASGLDAGKAGKLLVLLAPFILRALAKRQQAAPADTDGDLAGSLQREAEKAQANTSSPDIGGILGSILGSLGGRAT